MKRTGKNSNSKSEKKAGKPGLTPLGDRVLIRPFREHEEVRVGAIKIMLPENMAKEKSDHGKVLAVGAGKWEDGKLRPVSVKVGDTVIFSKYGYDEVKVDDEDLYLVREDLILAVVNS